MENLITSSEAAKILGLSEQRVRALAREMGGQQINPRLWLFDRAKVKEYAKRPRPKPGPKPRAKAE